MLNVEEEFIQDCFSEVHIGRNIDLNEIPLEPVCGNIENDDHEDSKEIILSLLLGNVFTAKRKLIYSIPSMPREMVLLLERVKLIVGKEKRKRREFFCHREGSPQLKIFDPSKKQRNKKSRRCNCKSLSD